MIVKLYYKKGGFDLSTHNSKNSSTIELNKRKQQFLNLNGIKVKIDGSWGPWQEQQYRRLTTKQKHYNPTLLGFLSSLYDRTLGSGTTYQEDPFSEGEIKEDNRSPARRYLDQQMHDNKTPLGYITQTVLPAAATATATVYGAPYIANGVRTAVANPSTILPAVKTLVKEGVKGVAGATAVNAASKATTGKTWGEQVAQSTGVSSDLGEWTNPGFALGSPVYKIGKDLYTDGGKYIFDHLPYKSIAQWNRFIQDAQLFFKTPLDQNPIKAVRDRHQALQVGPRTDVTSDNFYNTHKTSIQGIDDPIYQIRQRLRARMSNDNYQYSEPNDGTGIYIEPEMYDADHIISLIPVKEYLSLKDVYKLKSSGFDRPRDKVHNIIKTPIEYVKLNMNPAFAHRGNNRFIKVNKKALKDLGLDYSTALSHEYNHALRTYDLADQIFNIVKKMSVTVMNENGFNFDHLPSGYKGYLYTPTEIEARGTQLKNYFDSDVITPDMLKYAAKHYVQDTGVDNNMNQFFSGITDWDKAAQYLTTNSLKNGGKLTLTEFN